jgi:hypothetical protein
MANRIAPLNTFAGQSPPWSLANLDQNSSNIQGAINDSSLGFVNTGADTGTVNNYIVTLPYGSPTAYNPGFSLVLVAAATNTGPSTITVNPLGAVAIGHSDGSALTGGEIVAGQAVNLVYYGTAFRIVAADLSTVTSTITSVRLRSFNAVGNANFEIDQKLCGTVATLAAGTSNTSIDRWYIHKVGATAVCQVQQMAGPVNVPGTNFAITSKFLRITLTTPQAVLAASDQLVLYQAVEGCVLRELISDVTSLSVLVRSSVAGISFGTSLNDSVAGYSLVKLSTIPSAGTWTMIPFPNLPLWTASGSFPITPGSQGYSIGIAPAAGTTVTASSNDLWVAGAFRGAVGQSNYFGSAAGATFDVAFCQHEPGANCTQLMDLPFSQNYDQALRYYQKSYDYAVAVGTVTSAGMIAPLAWAATTAAVGPVRFSKPMAKVPTVTLYNHATGAAGSVRDNASVDHASAVAGNIGTTGFPSITFATATTAIMPINAHYTADTGW